MNSKERMMAVLRREEPDHIPFTLYAETQKLLGLAIYEPWRKLLDKGLCLFAALAIQTHKAECPKASMDITHHYKSQTSWSPVDLMMSMNKPHEISGEIKTPVGTDKFFAKMDSMDLTEMLPWFPQDGFFIKTLEDYEIFRHLIEDTEYTPDYENVVGFQQIIGNYGIVPTFVPKSPFQSMIMLMGPHRLAIDYYTHRKEFDELYNAIYKKELEVYKIAAESPAEVIWGPDNVTGLITSPKFFKEYSLKFYNEVADIFHKHDKIYVVHMDGELKCLADLIAETRIDAIESFTPPPVGDFTIKEARKKWKDKVIWSNFPEPVCLQGQKAVIETTQNMLEEAAPGNNFMLGVSEGFPSFMHMLSSVPNILDTVMKYPIGK
ncbi:MAG: uroporphyrinogen decarboxylase family protein [Promethearchaeota archaeon]